MKQSPLVSVVVPTFNQGNYLPVALDSVMFQSYPNIEIIICNHGSTDGTSEIIANYLDAVDTQQASYLHHMEIRGGEEHLVRKEEGRFPGGRLLKYIEGEEDIGGTSSYNEGFKRARGTYCTYLVADDYFLPHAIARLVETLENSQADVAYSDLFVVDDGGRILQRLSKPEYTFDACFCDWFHLGVSRLYRKTLHEGAGWYDPEYRNANDYDMFLRFAMAGAKFVHLPEVLYCTRKHDPKNPDEPASWRDSGYENLMRESIKCAKRARRYREEQYSK